MIGACTYLRNSSYHRHKGITIGAPSVAKDSVPATPRAINLPILVKHKRMIRSTRNLLDFALGGNEDLSKNRCIPIVLRVFIRAKLSFRVVSETKQSILRQNQSVREAR